MFKNWPEICKLGEAHRFLMLTFCYLDLPSEAARRLALGFPECFSDVLVHGPIPFSYLKAWVSRENPEEAELQELREGWRRRERDRSTDMPLHPPWIDQVRIERFARFV